MTSDIKTAYLAADGFQDRLEKELEGILEVKGRLFLTERPRQNAFWAQNIWLNPKALSIRSISHGASELKAIQRNWWNYSFDFHRRSKLIQEKLPHVSAKPLQFPSPQPKSPLGSWTLLDANTILAASDCSSLFPNGEIFFEEDKTGPPNRAYLKLWEALTVMDKFPRPGEFCLDLGGSPGGWAWAIQKLGARVLSVDRSPLDPQIADLPGITFQRGNVFSLSPDSFLERNGKLDWLFCDVVCYPEKLYEWILPWVESGICRHFLGALKFQGNNNYEIAQKFAEIPGSRIVHLFHNKHELTWFFSHDSGPDDA